MSQSLWRHDIKANNFLHDQHIQHINTTLLQWHAVHQMEDVGLSLTQTHHFYLLSLGPNRNIFSHHTFSFIFVQKTHIIINQLTQVTKSKVSRFPLKCNIALANWSTIRFWFKDTIISSSCFKEDLKIWNKQVFGELGVKNSGLLGDIQNLDGEEGSAGLSLEELLKEMN